MADPTLNDPGAPRVPAATPDATPDDAAGGDPVALSRALLAAAREMDGAVTAPVRELAAALGACDPAALATDDDRQAFWLNVYNALVLHALVAYGVRGSLLVHLGFFQRAAYTVGGARYSLHVIEHGVLRCNRPAPWTFWRPLRADDPRAAMAPTAVDPRVHFALNCGAVSCPPIRTYDPAQLDRQLDLATRSYLATEVAVDLERRVVRAPYLCKLYRRDFGDDPAVLAFIARHVDAPETRAWIEAHLTDARLAWGPYQWTVKRG